MNNIIKIKDLSTNAKIEYCKQVEKRSFYSRERWIAKYLRIKLMIKKVRDEQRRLHPGKKAN
jgi:hypothetical protein